MEQAIRSLLLLLAACMLAASVSADPLPDYHQVYVQVANDPGAKYDIYGNNTYHFVFNGSATQGLGSLYVTNDISVPEGQVTTTSNQSGTFYITYPGGGKGFDDAVILMLAVNGTISNDFEIHIKSSGYDWTPVPAKSQKPAMDEVSYVDCAVNETFTITDLIYGPQTWRPMNCADYPIHDGQNTGDCDNVFNLVFIDLNVGVLCEDDDLINLTDSGAIKIKYRFENLHSFAVFNAYAWCNQSNRGKGVFWTNRLTGTGQHSGYNVIGVAPPVLTSITVSSPNTALNVSCTQQFNATAYDQDGDEMIDVSFTWTSSNETVGMIGENGLFTALSPGNATITAEHGNVNGTMNVTVRFPTGAEDNENQDDDEDIEEDHQFTPVITMAETLNETANETVPTPTPAPTEESPANVTPTPNTLQAPTTPEATQHPSPTFPSSPEPESAGFGVLFAFIGLLAVAYLIKWR
ncbi:MAG: hypothetical protein AEth_01624 [Candidatus Argoarchaeum ethanivorans]|uniref:BIG2 domain-containing protein n=1 Tax=Candidatus Argoarchaeum ethanivorans TaxID=2608793 RepID=A0A8B3S1I7_9EURY|nr:MAG: hypothetical protein AEth_01624 [Candidatus Argoarchaeum ethanivorans]